MSSESSETAFFLKHSFIYGLGTVAGQLVGFVMLPIYTRYLTPKDYGVLQLIEISTFLLGMVITTGIAQTLSRFYYEHEEKDKRNKTVSTMYITYFIIALLVSPLLYYSSPILASKVLDSHKYTHFFYVSFISFILGGLLDIGLAHLRINKKSISFALISISQLIIMLSLNIYFIVFREMGILGILYSVLITRAFYQIILTVPILLGIKPRFSLKYFIQMLKFSLPLIPARLANSIVNQSDRYFIRYFISIGDVGIYSLAQKLGVAVHMFITVSFQMVFEPRRFEIVKRPDAKETFNKIFVYYCIIIVFAGLGISVFIPEIFKIMVTPEFYRAGEITPLIILTMVFFGLRNHFEFGILWSKKTMYYAYINGIMSVINLIFNYVFITQFGLWGAIYSLMLTTIIHNVLIYVVGKKFYFIKFEFFKVFKLFAVAILLYLISLMIQADLIFINIILKTVLMIIFMVSLYGLKIIDKNEIAILKGLLINEGTSYKPAK